MHTSRSFRRPSVWLRIAFIGCLFGLTFYPLGEHETTVGWMLPGMLEYLMYKGSKVLLALAVTFYVLHGLKIWPTIARSIDWGWKGLLAHPRKAIAGIMLVFFSIAVALCYTLYGFMPRVPDSIAQYVHAKIVAQGKLLGNPLPFPSSFKMLCTLYYPHFISHYMPGHTLFLAIGHLLHMPWIINPLLGTLSVGIIFALARETHGTSIAFGAALLTLISTYMLFMSAEFMNHATSMFFSACFMLCFIRIAKYHRIADGLLAGLCLGSILMTRTFTAVMIAYPAALYACYWLVTAPAKERMALFRAFMACALGALLFVPPMFYFNILTTGDPFVFSNQLTQGASNTIGFGPIPDDIQGWVKARQHTFWRGLLYSSNNLIGLNYLLFRWPFPNLLPLMFLFLLRSRNDWNIIFLTFCISLLMGHMLYYTQDWCFGPRYLYEVAPLLVIMSAAGLARIPVYTRFLLRLRIAPSTFRAGMVLLCLTGFAIGLKTWHRYNIDGCTVPYRNVYQQALEMRLKNALLLVPDLEYITSSVAGPPYEDADIIVARDIDDTVNQALMDYYPTRNVYRVDADRNFTLIRRAAPPAKP